MKPITRLTFAAAILALCSCATQKQQAEPQFSTFSDHYISVMKEDGCSLREAAQWVRSIGIEGVDARVELTDEQMAEFIAAGIKPACAILDIAHTSMTPAQMLAMEDKAIDFCRKYGFERILYVPVLPKPGAAESVLDSLRQNAVRVTDKFVAAGLDVVFEDYDNPLSIVYNMEALDKIFALSPDAKCAYDSGNFVYAGDDPMEAFDKYKSRIAHVHLKDRYAVADKESAVIGTGIAHCREVMEKLLADGYKGWFTVEGYGVKDMKTHLTESVRNMTAAPETAKANVAKEKGMGVQLYSLRTLIGTPELFAQNHAATLTQVREMGFTGVEAASYADGKFSGLEPAEFRKTIESFGLTITSSHTNRHLTKEELASGDLSKALDWWKTCIADHKAAGIPVLVMASESFKSTKHDLQVMADYLNAIGRMCNEAGIKFGYHNHHAEFRQVEDTTMMDYLLQNTNPACVFYELDVWWAVYAGVNPVDYMKNYPGRYAILHIKDKNEIGQSGMVDFGAIFSAFDVAGTKSYIVELEQASTPDIMLGLKQSADYLKGAGLVK